SRNLPRPRGASAAERRNQFTDLLRVRGIPVEFHVLLPGDDRLGRSSLLVERVAELLPARREFRVGLGALLEVVERLLEVLLVLGFGSEVEELGRVDDPRLRAP